MGIFQQQGQGRKCARRHDIKRLWCQVFQPAIADFGRGDDAGQRAAAVQPQPVALEGVRIGQPADRLVLGGRGVAVHHGGAEIFRGAEKLVTNPHEVMGLLVGQGNAGTNACMNKKITAKL